MVLRQNSAQRMVISQPTHAWVAGQIAAAWVGVSSFAGGLLPELLFAVQMHDVGYLDWEEAALLDPDTGLPHTYRTIPTLEHLQLWRRGISRMLPVNRFAALMISLHSQRLYEEHFKPAQSSLQEREAVDVFVKEQEDFQRNQIGELTRENHYSLLREASFISQCVQLLKVWDLLSLLACEGIDSEESVPTASHPAPAGRFTVSPASRLGEKLRIDPWPFKRKSVVLRFDAKPVTSRFKSAEDLCRYLARTPAQTCEARFVHAQ